MAFFDTMQDFSKEKCNIYVDFNTCLHNTRCFVGAHIVYARAWGMKDDKTNKTNKADRTDRADKTNKADCMTGWLVDYLKMR